MEKLYASRIELEALRYNPVDDYESRRDVGRESEPKKKKKLKRCTMN